MELDKDYKEKALAQLIYDNFLCDKLIRNSTDNSNILLETKESLCLFKKQKISCKFKPYETEFKTKRKQIRDNINSINWVSIPAPTWGAYQQKNQIVHSASDSDSLGMVIRSKPTLTSRKDLTFSFNYRGLDFLVFRICYYDKSKVYSGDYLNEFDLKSNVLTIDNNIIVLKVSNVWCNPITFESNKKNNPSIDMNEKEFILMKKCLNLLLMKQYVRNNMVEKDREWVKMENQKKKELKEKREERIYNEILEKEFDIINEENYNFLE